MSEFISKEGDYIIIVSGLPRSGTSMMMQMLDAGGVPVLKDDIREADVDNPKGYYEYEKVKELERDSSWLEMACGKVVKIVSPLLFHLKIDGGFRYKIIFMRRDLDEVLMSQRKMADRLKRDEDRIEDERLKHNYLKHLEDLKIWLRDKDNIEVEEVDYSLTLQDPKSVAERIRDFLGTGMGVDLDTEAMARVVSESLYRQRAKDRELAASDAASKEEADREIIMQRLKTLGYL